MLTEFHSNLSLNTRRTRQSIQKIQKRKTDKKYKNKSETLLKIILDKFQSRERRGKCLQMKSTWVGWVKSPLQKEVSIIYFLKHQHHIWLSVDPKKKEHIEFWAISTISQSHQSYFHGPLSLLATYKITTTELPSSQWSDTQCLGLQQILQKH